VDDDASQDKDECGNASDYVVHPVEHFSVFQADVDAFKFLAHLQTFCPKSLKILILKF
jgi:hypothetical protein